MLFHPRTGRSRPPPGSLDDLDDPDRHSRSRWFFWRLASGVWRLKGGRAGIPDGSPVGCVWVLRGGRAGLQCRPLASLGVGRTTGQG
jgi:hypothetical protein